MSQEQSVFDHSQGHTAKIHGVLTWLSSPKNAADEDLVLVVDGYDVWFQLPLHILRQRYFRLGRSLIFGADKICWPNAPDDPACTAVPPSTLPANAYGSETDKDPFAFRNRPRYLNSGNVIGPARHVRALYEQAYREVVEFDKGGLGDQYVFSAIFGDQEKHRSFFGESDISRSESRPRDLKIGLDYESRLFQTMTHSDTDVEFLRHTQLPKDMERFESPLSYASLGDRSRDNETSGYLLPHSSFLDDLPANEKIKWSDVLLATNIISQYVPVLLHINGDKSLLESWWPRMWFYPYSRALLRRYIRSTQTKEAFRASMSPGPGNMWADGRGGRGGVWSDFHTWLAWQEVCPDTEAIFGDGKGRWGLEEGDGRIYNKFGKLVASA